MFCLLDEMLDHILLNICGQYFYVPSYPLSFWIVLSAFCFGVLTPYCFVYMQVAMPYTVIRNY